MKEAERQAALHAQVRHNKTKPSKGVTFRERREGVVVYKDGLNVFSSEWYTTSATWAKDRYNLSDAELYAIYEDYKKHA